MKIPENILIVLFLIFVIRMGFYITNSATCGVKTVPPESKEWNKFLDGNSDRVNAQIEKEVEERVQAEVKKRLGEQSG